MSAERNAYMRRWRASHPEKLRVINARHYQNHKGQKNAQSREWAQRNPESTKQIEKRYRENHAERERSRKAKWRLEHPDYNSTYYRERRRRDESFRLLCRLRKRLWAALRGKSQSTKELLGCDVGVLRCYFESQFKRGMTWANYGKRWEVDHIIPCAKFDLSRRDHQRRCFHFTNLQPLFVPANRTKRDRTYVR